MKKDLYILTAHIDDFECSCFGFLFKHQKEYENIHIVVATTWPAKVSIWEENLKTIHNNVSTKVISTNLGFEQRKIPTFFDDVKNKFYSLVDFNRRFDILSHDANDTHTDHIALNQIAMGLYKYCNKFITYHSPSSIKFDPNYWIGLTDDVFNIKKESLDRYNIQKEQSYTKSGYYLQSDEHYNIGRAYLLENFSHDDYEYYEAYKILKWLSNGC